MKHLGSCLCGEVAFEIQGDLSDISVCHCSICRKASGSAFAAYGAAPVQKFNWKRGRNSLRNIQISELLSKQFCRLCGSVLVTLHQSEPDIYHVSLGNLDDSNQIEIEYHQFAGSKACWYSINDSKPQYEQWPDEE